MQKFLKKNLLLPSPMCHVHLVMKGNKTECHIYKHCFLAGNIVLTVASLFHGTKTKTKIDSISFVQTFAYYKVIVVFKRAVLCSMAKKSIFPGNTCVTIYNILRPSITSRFNGTAYYSSMLSAEKHID